jgi:hypothetical protein
MGTQGVFISPQFGFWLAIYAASITVLALWRIWALESRLRAGKRVTWDIRSEYIDVAEFSNRNIPLKVTYKGNEPRWLWATYLSLRNTGRGDIATSDNPERQHFIVGAEGCRYIGFNRLISEKAKVTLSPLFRGNDVYCKIDFDCLGPGDEILASLLFVADDKRDVELQGALFGANSHLTSGVQQRVLAWRGLWWLLLALIVVGSLTALLTYQLNFAEREAVQLQMQVLGVIYSLALATAAVLLRPIRHWQQLPEQFQEHGTQQRRGRVWQTIRFILGLTDEL